MVLPSRWMPHLGTFVVVMQAEWLMLCYSPSSYPTDLAAYRSFDHPDLFLSIKRDLAMVSNFNLIFFLLTYYFLNLSHFFTVHNRSRNKFTWLRSGGRAFVMRQGLPTRPERLQRLI